jgi:hypothetical protein
MAPYQIFTDATADCSSQWLASLPPIGIIPMRVEIGGQEYTYGSGWNDLSEPFLRPPKGGKLCFHLTNHAQPILSVF